MFSLDEGRYRLSGSLSYHEAVQDGFVEVAIAMTMM